MANFQERYRPVVVGVNATVTLTSLAAAGFLPKTSGTITLTNSDGTVIVDAVPVTAGFWCPIPFFLAGRNAGGTFTTAGGASGTLGV